MMFVIIVKLFCLLVAALASKFAKIRESSCAPPLCVCVCDSMHLLTSAGPSVTVNVDCSRGCHDFGIHVIGDNEPQEKLVHDLPQLCTRIRSQPGHSLNPGYKGLNR